MQDPDEGIGQDACAIRFFGLDHACPRRRPGFAG
jgi:hypothetical protein